MDTINLVLFCLGVFIGNIIQQIITKKNEWEFACMISTVQIVAVICYHILLKIQ